MKRVSSSLVPPIALDRSKRYPVYRQLYDWFQRAIASGQLRPGQRVPSTRSLAAELNVSRIPVLNAFEQLHAEGYLQTFVGAGTWVASSIPQETIGPSTGKISGPAQKKGTRRISQGGLAATLRAPQPWLNLSGAFRMHLPALDHFPTDVWSRLVARNARKSTMDTMAYGDSMGYAPFREVIAEYLGAVRAVRCDPAQVMVVAGSQQGLQISARVLLNPGEAVWMEEPGYPGAHQAFRTAKARLIPVPVDNEGLNVENGIHRCRNARAAYITPSHQYPLGTTMSATRRLQLLNWASRTGSWIIEDDYDSEYRFGSRPIASLQGLDSDARVIYIGTFSKVLFPALRLGYMVVPTDLIPAFSTARDAADIFSSTLYQAVLTDFIKEGHFARHIRRMRILYADRRNALAEAIHEEIGGMLEIVSAEAGMHLVGLLPRGMKDTEISQNAARIGISAMPLSICYLNRPLRGGLVLGYGGTDGAQIHDGAHKLKMCL
ncbi:MAG TPA: PLP-dependent aminotransferase family protein [Candidatus Acidoferrales bacterium]|nr:PLP-dependent aminotransferase family protein [Candidatus Acidoferrales bacterium]